MALPKKQPVNRVTQRKGTKPAVTERAHKPRPRLIKARPRLEAVLSSTQVWPQRAVA